MKHALLTCIATILALCNSAYSFAQKQMQFEQNDIRYYIISGTKTVSAISIWSLEGNQGGLNQGGINFDDDTPKSPTEVVIPSSLIFEGNTYTVVSIEKEAFSGCTRLSSITIPATVKTIGEKAFANCPLKSIINNATTPQSITDDTFSAYTATLTVPASAKEAYKNANVWKKFANINTTTGGEEPPVTTKYVKSITLSTNCDTNEEDDYVIEIGDTKKIFASCLPTDAENKNVIWESNKPTIISVDANGNITAIKEGVAIISATAADGSNVKEVLMIEVIAPQPKIETLPDGGSSIYVNPADKDVDEIKYTRKFNNTNWQALYVPFSMNYADWADDFEVAKINAFYEYDTDEDGTIDKQVLEIFPVKSGTLRPNHPYLIKAKVAGEKTLVLKNATLYATEENSIECSTVETKYIFTGTYETMTGLKSNGYYFMSGGGLKTAATDETKLGAFRWYLKVENKEGQIINNSSEINIRVIGEEETAIENIESNNNVDSVYALDGRKINMSNLKSGIYIKNGKKIYIK